MNGDSVALTSAADPPEDFYVLESMVSEHDADGDAPLRRGEQPFSWAVVESLSQSVLERYQDLRVAIWLLRAAMHQRTAQGMSQGFAVISRLLQDRLPEQRSDDEREDLLTQLSWLVGPSFRLQLERLETGLEAPAEVLGGLVHRGTVAVVGGGQDALLAALQASLSSLEEIDAYCKQLEPALAPDFTQIMTLLRQGQQALTRTVEGDVASDLSAADSSVPATSLLAVNSREDALRSLDALLKYFVLHEPGHPAPLLLARVQRMVGASFESLMNELYQDGPKLVQLINTPRQS